MTSPITITATVTDAVGTVFTAKTTASQSGGTTPPPTSTFPDASNTGVPQGTTLTNSGSLTLGTAGQTVNALNITGQVTIAASNVTLQNCHIQSNATNAQAVVRVNAGLTGVLISRCTILGIGATDTVGTFGVYTLGGCTVDGCDISQCQHPVHVGNAPGNVVIRNSYLHNFVAVSSSHYDGLYYGGGSTSTGFSLLFQNNTVVNTNSQTSAVSLKGDFGAIDNCTVTGNLLEGGGYTIYSADNGKGYSNVSFTNNALVKAKYGYVYPSQTAITTWNGNYDYNTNAPITSP